MFAGRGISVKRGLLSDSAQVVLFLALLLFCTHSWCACTTTAPYTSGCSYLEAWGAPRGCNYEQWGRCPPACAQVTAGVSGTSVLVGPIVGQNSDPCRCNASALISCSTQAEADSAYCAQNPTAEGCVEEDVPSACEADYQQCVSLGGVWQKVASTSTQCASTCDLCNSSAETKVKNRLNQVCCQQGKAPPDSNSRCIPPTIGSNWGMAGSSFVNNDGNVQCGSLTTSDGEIIQENADLYKKFCIDGDQYEEQADSNEYSGSSSAESSSSSEQPKSSFQTELEGLEGLYGVLDTIRDTLVKRLTPATEEIKNCLYNWQTCTGMTNEVKIDASDFPVDSTYLRIDTTLKRLIRPLMDSTIKIDSAQLKVLKQLDSLYKRGLVNDTDIVQAVNAIKGDINDVEDAVKGVKHGIDSLIDSMTTYMDKVGQGIGAVGDSVGALRGDFNGFLEGEGTVPGDTTWDGYSDVYEEGSDSVGNSYLRGLGGQLDSALNDTAFDRIFAPGGGSPGPADSARLPTVDSMQRVLDSSVVAQRSELEDTLHAAFDTLKDEFMLLDYDSLILAPLGVRVPNTNTCPEHCFTFDISGENSNQNWLGGLGTLDFGFCRNLPGLGFDVFFLIRIIGRLFTAMFCIYIGLWFIAGRKN